MTLQMANDVGSWLASLYKKEEAKSYRISFLGGEPSINLDAVCTITDKLDLMYQNPIRKDYLLFTNGDFLTLPALYRIKRRKLRVMFNPTMAPLDEIERKITMFKKYLGGCWMSIVLDECNIERIEEIVKLALKYHCHTRISRLYNGGIDLDYVQKYKEVMHKVFDLLLDSDWVMHYNQLIDSFYLGAKNKNPYSCGKFYMTIDPDGSIRSCSGDYSTKIGHITTHHKLSDLRFIQRWTAKDAPECQECEYVSFCQAGCPLVKKLAYGTYQGKSPFCGALKELLPRLIQLKNKWEEQHGLEQNLASF